ncbi:hypothetical protein [Haloarchaeobius sp. FL176]|nr:hypothetical protein [Haloarchaeobius sp. FL176]
MASTLGWSLVSSGIVTLVLAALPGSDVLWGVLLLVLGVVVLARRL